MKNETKKLNVHRLTFSAVMLALATCLALICSLLPLSLPYGGGFTIASMLPIVLVSYIYGVKWGFFTSFTYAVIQMILDLIRGRSSTIIAFFLPDSDFAIYAGIIICLLDYVLAYSILGIGGIFRKKLKSKGLSLTLGTVIALSARYIIHIVSGYIFYGAYAEWFFSENFFSSLGSKILSALDGQVLAFVYSVIYNGLYMIPEIVITAVAAVLISRLPQVKPVE